jgi:hypothetical protein
MEQFGCFIDYCQIVLRAQLQQQLPRSRNGEYSRSGKEGGQTGNCCYCSQSWQGWERVLPLLKIHGGGSYFNFSIPFFYKNQGTSQPTICLLGSSLTRHHNSYGCFKHLMSSQKDSLPSTSAFKSASDI